MPTFGNGDVYVHWIPNQVIEIDREATLLHATRSDLIKYYVQEGMKATKAMSKEERHKLMRAFENNEVLDKPPAIPESEF